MNLGATSVVVATLIARSVFALNGCAVADSGSIPIASGDILLFGNANLTQTVVPADGKVVIPLAGEVQVLGQTPNHLAQLVRERLSKYTNKSAVQIYVEDDGQQEQLWTCREPGTVIEALGFLGVIRRLENEHKTRFPWGQILRFNYKEARKGYQGEQIIVIETARLPIAKS
jgi:hypothetical protein